MTGLFPRLSRLLGLLNSRSVMFALCLSLAILPTLRSRAQPANDNGPVQRLLAANPLLAAVQNASPSALPVLTTKLEELAVGSRQGQSRAGLSPTQAEQAQIAANPAFAQAQQNNADETLLLLRSANQMLRQQRSGSVDQGQRVALVIGNGHYQNWQWRELSGTRADAELVSAALRKAGFTLIGGGPQLDLDSAAMARDIAELRAASHKGTTSLLYFAGHGLQKGGLNYILPTNATETSSLLQVQETMLDTLENKDGSIKVIVLDACRDETIMRGYSSNLQGLSLPGTASMTAGTFMIYSTAPNSVAIDHLAGQANSPFAAAFVREMMKPGLDIRPMLEAVSQDVSQMTDNHQKPWILQSAAAGSFYFLRPGDQSVALTGLPIAPPVVSYTRNGMSDEQLMAAAKREHFAGRYDAEKPLLAEAARRGIPGALYELGFQYDEGVGREKDFRQAAFWYQKSGEAGNAVAWNNLGLLYQNGQGVPQDMQTAISLFRKADALGEDTGTTNLGVAYQHGFGVAQNLGYAEALFKKASAHGYLVSMTNLGRLYHDERNYRDGHYWTKLAASSNFRPAIEDLSRFYGGQ